MRPYLNNVSGKSDSDVITLQGGLNTCFDKSFIRDNQMPYMINVAPIKSPTLSTRSNRMSFGAIMTDTSMYALGEVYALFASSSNVLYEIEYHDETQNYVYKYIQQGRTLEKVYVGSVAPSSDYSICECRDEGNVYIIISTPSKKYIYTEGGALVEQADAYTGVVEAHKNRLWVANGTKVWFSNLADYDNFTISQSDPINTAGEIDITNAKGEIMGLVSYDGKLIVLCERSWHIIYGSTPNPELDQFSLVDMSDGLGCASKGSYTICDRRLYWLDSDCSVHMYNGSSVTKVSEPYGDDNYGSYGGIKDIVLNRKRIKYTRMASFDNFVYLICTASVYADALNDMALVYDTRNRVWWREDGAFTEITRWDTDTDTHFGNKTDYLVGARYNGDLVIMNCLEETGQDILFNTETRHLDTVDIEYTFETKTWLLGSAKHKKTLTNIWFEANADADVYVNDNWTDKDAWNNDENDYIPLGKMKPVHAHEVRAPEYYSHEGGERQRFIVPKMYIQKVNAFSIRVNGKGQGYFYLLEKEWRIK